MSAPVVTVEPRGHVAIVWLDDPERRNAMAPAFWDEFPATVAGVSAEPGCRAIVVAAHGPAFTVGLDLAAFGSTLGEGGSTVADRRQTLAMVKRMQRTFSALADCPQPVIVATHGWCIGAGVDLVTAADIRIAAADTVFSIRETRLAMVADVGTLQRLPRIIGPGHVAELVYTGRDFSAAEAEGMGLVNRVLPDRDAAIAHAVELAGPSPPTLRSPCRGRRRCSVPPRTAPWRSRSTTWRCGTPPSSTRATSPRRCRRSRRSAHPSSTEPEQAKSGRATARPAMG